MSEQIKNINPWVEKLEQITLPNAAEQWPAMKTLLDEEMPVTKRKKPGIWFWLIISLLLIGSIFFGILHLSKFEQKKNILSNNQTAANDKIKEHSLINSDDSLKENKNDLKTQAAKMSSTENADKNKNSLSKTTDSLKNKEALNNMKSENDKKIITENKNRNSESVAPNSEKKIYSNNRNRNKKPDNSTIENKQENSPSETSLSNSTKRNIASNHKNILADKEKKQTKNNSEVILSQPTKKLNSDKKRNNKTYIESNSTAQANDKRKSPNDKSNKNKNVSSETNDFDSSRLIINNQPLNENKNAEQPLIKDSSAITKTIPQLHSDSTKKTDTANKRLVKINKADSINNKKKKDIVLSAGIGFNQSFPISGQQFSNLNSNGGNNILTDYIPIPFFRVSFNKKIYFQIEAQINSPQYTKDLLAKSKPTVNSVGGSLVVTTQDSGTIKKLYYFNIPISFHYNFFKNFYAGAGIQFSMLTNGVGSFQSRRDSATNGHSTFILTSSATGNLKSNSVFDELKKNELRFLFDVNCQWKNLIFGARYTQALSNFIDEQISASQTTKASNSSLQFYLQYILWKNKKTGKSLSK